MERILEALANDDLSTMASTIKENPEYGESMKEICEIENILYAALNPTESSNWTWPNYQLPPVSLTATGWVS